MSDGGSGPAADPLLSETVRDVLQERIIRGQYAQGSRVKEASLAKDLGVSRVPLRAAIPQLRVRGLVRTLPRRGAVVFRWTPDAVNHLFDARLAIEAAAAGYAARRVGRGGSSIESLVDAVERSRQAVENGDPYDIAIASTLIHQRIVELAGNDLLSSAMHAVEGQLAWIFYLTSARDARLACAEHDELCDAIGSGSVELARALAYAHIESGRVPTLNVMYGAASTSG